MSRQDELARLLRADDAPWGTYLRAKGARAAEVPVLVEHVELRLGGSDVERELDDFVRAAGGERRRMIDPWTSGPNLLRRLTGRATRPKADVYELPPEFFEAR
jgi:hypothetical protein